MNYSKSEAIQELERELEMRKSVYPRWVQIKRLDKDTALRRIYCIQRAINLLNENDGGSNKSMVRYGEMMEELRREVTFREKLYPKQIQSGKISATIAKKRYGAFRAAIHHLTGEDLNPISTQGDLFGGASHTQIES